MVTRAGDLEPYLEETAAMARRMPVAELACLVELLVRACEAERMIFVFGNGGSAATASHFANDLGKGGMAGFPRRFRVIALTDCVPLLTAWANDTDYNRVFAEQLRNFAGPGDVAIAISGSGNSGNVLAAVDLARERGATTVGLTGASGGALAGRVDLAVRVPSDDMQHIEDLHLVALHLVYAAIRDGYMAGRAAEDAGRPAACRGVEVLPIVPPGVAGLGMGERARAKAGRRAVRTGARPAAAAPR